PRRVLVFDAASAEIRAKVTDPNVLVEPEIHHWAETIPPPGLGGPVPFANPLPPLGNSTARIDVTANGQRLPNATVTLYFLDGTGAKMLQARTDATGDVEFNVPITATLSAYVIMPADSFWTMVIRGPSLQETIDCPPLPATGPIEWWHRLLGITDYDPALGQGIKV